MKRTTSLVVGLAVSLVSMGAFAAAPKAPKAGTETTAPAKPAKTKKAAKGHTAAPKPAAAPGEGAGDAK